MNIKLNIICNDHRNMNYNPAHYSTYDTRVLVLFVTYMFIVALKYGKIVEDISYMHMTIFNLR